MDLQQFLIIVGSILFIIIIVYIFSYLTSSDKLLSSFPVQNATTFEADQFYYLPGYDLRLNLKGSFKISKDEAGIIREVTLQSLQVTPEAIIVPDVSSLIGIKCTLSVFTNDELTISKNAEGLLSTTSFSSEDRIGSIISSMVSSTEINKAAIAAEPDRENITYTSIEVEEVFYIYCHQIKKGSLNLIWKLSLTENEKNIIYPISFTINSPFLNLKNNINEYNGLISRVTSLQKFTISYDSEVIEFNVIAPNLEQVIQVPVRKPFFNTLKTIPSFTNGILSENKLSKPSEVEGFASIPINILKAIVSIPAQLFQFKITQIKNEAVYEKELKELREAKGITSREQETVENLAKKIKDLEQLIASNNNH